MSSYDFDSLWDYSHPDETEAKFRELLLQIPEDDPARVELLTQIARSQGLQRKFLEAHATLDGVEKQLTEGLSRPQVRYLLERGRVFNSSGHAEDARPFFELALNQAKALSEDFYAVDAAHMLAIIAAPGSSLAFNLQAIQMAESSKEEKARNWLGSLYNNTGWSYHDMGDFETALKIFEKAEAWRRSQGKLEQVRIASWGVGRMLRSLNRIDEALSKQMALKNELETTGETDGYVFEEIGECLLLLDRKQESAAYFAKAYEVLSTDAYLAEQEPERLARLRELSNNQSL